MPESSPIDRGETPTLEDLETMPESRYRFLTFQKQDKLFDALDGQNRRIAACEHKCRSWHGPVIRWLVGLVLLIGGSAITYLAILVCQHIFAKGGG